MVRWLIALGLCAFSVTASAEPSCQELNRLWREKYASEFHVQWAVREFACTTRDRDHKLARAIDLLYRSDPQHSFYENARALTRQITLGGRCEGTDARDPVHVAAWMSQEGHLTLCDAFFDEIRETERRAAALVHEAAHALPRARHRNRNENENEHVLCADGDLEGHYACDREFTESYQGGPYNWEVQYVSYMRRNTTSDDARWIFDARLRQLLNDHFNNITQAQKRRWSRP